MAYLTRYSLRWDIPYEGDDQLISTHGLIEAALAEDCDSEFAYALWPDGSSSEPSNWHDHEDHMRWFSRKFPRVTFELFGEGEDHSDAWKKQFLNGKMRESVAELVFPEWSEWE